MKTKSTTKTKFAFIVREDDSTVKVITEGNLKRDIKVAHMSHYETKVKSKLFDKMAAEAIQEINGQSITREQYESNLGVYATAIELYSNISLLQLSEIAAKSLVFDRVMEKKEESKEEQLKEETK